MLRILSHVPSWIQGHPEFDFGFKALVCHDGVRFVVMIVDFPVWRCSSFMISLQVFDTKNNAFATEELYFVHDLPRLIRHALTVNAPFLGPTRLWWVTLVEEGESTGREVQYISPNVRKCTNTHLGSRS